MAKCSCDACDSKTVVADNLCSFCAESCFPMTRAGASIVRASLAKPLRESLHASSRPTRDAPPPDDFDPKAMGGKLIDQGATQLARAIHPGLAAGLRALQGKIAPTTDPAIADRGAAQMARGAKALAQFGLKAALATAIKKAGR